MNYKKLFGGILLTAALVWWAPSVRAADTSVMVQPAIAEQVVDPARLTTMTVMLTNTTDSFLPVVVAFKPFDPVNPLQHAESSLKRYNAAGWMACRDDCHFILRPQQSRPVTVEVTPPKGAEPGGHYVTILFEVLVPQDKAMQKSMLVNANVGVRTLLTVKGATRKYAELSHVTPSFSAWVPGRVTLDAGLVNSGNMHLLPHGMMRLRDWRGQTVKELALPPNLVLPDEEKSYQLQTDAPLFGLYEASFEAAYDGQPAHKITQTVTFVVFPWGVAAAIAVVGFLVWLVGFKTRGRWAKAWRTFRDDNTSSHV